MSKPNKAGELRDVEVSAISLVGKPANRKAFQIFKSEEKPAPPPVEPQASVESEEHNFFKAVKEFFVGKAEPIAKAGKKISAARRDALKAAHEALGMVLSETEENNSEGETDVNKDQLLEIMKEVLKPIEERLAAIEKDGEEKPEETPTEAPKEETPPIAEVIKAALEPLMERLEKVEKARGVSNKIQSDGGEENVEKTAPDWGRLF